MQQLRGFRVFGKVQGVFFRHSTRLEGERLHIRGTARNLSDGSVEVIASGPPQALEDLRSWLSRGPVKARVERVEDFEPGEAELPEGFEVR